MISEWLNTTFAMFDGRLFEFYHSLAIWGGSVLTPIMNIISAFGKSGIFPIVLSVVLLLFKKTRKIGLCSLFAIGVNALFVNGIIKPLVARERPYTHSPYEKWWQFVGSPTESDKAFPSGHVAVFTACMYAIFWASKNKKLSWLVIIPTILMGISRNYLIVHYATDVIVGYVLGVIFSVVGYYLGKFVYGIIEKNKHKKACSFMLGADILDLFKKEKKMKVAVLIANGSEEIEALTPVDVIRRTGIDCDLISVNEKVVTCSHNVLVTADKRIEEADLSMYDALVIPGGMPGATNIATCVKAVEGIRGAIENGKVVASICASPAVVLADNGLTEGYKATCYPATQFIQSLGENYTGADVEIDRNLITANGPKSALKFSLAICEALNVTPKF
ncbi:MAG: phosphatase PAP2 family protein [Clostridiales bacterium]|nr:phosphatase PAP2 family protein [Clostridiales bacterium]